MNLIGKSLKSRYIILSILGEGGMARVYLANDIINKREVAVKIIKEDSSLDPLNIARFQREARASASLSHDNIIKIYDIDEYKGRPYMVMEYVKGKSLKEVLKSRGRLTSVEASDIIYQLSDALYHAHSHGIIHRDVKPQNVMICSDGKIKLGDFGIALINDAPHITQKDTILGSVHYMAPEICKGIDATISSDIYSLGITFFELLTGKLPFDDSNALNIALKQIKEEIPSVRKYNVNVDKRIEKVINKACKKEIKNRYLNMKEFKKDLVEALDPSKEKENFFKKILSKVKKDG